jgi:hypothetical protein
MTMTDIARVRCAYCGELFSPSRFDNQHQRANAPAIASSLYCRPACKQAAYRRRKDIAAGIPASARRHRPPKARLRPRGSVTQAQNSVPDSYVRGSVTRAEIPQENQSSARPFLATEAPRRNAAKLDSRIVPDATYSGMYRIRRADGSLSDMVNLTRARDAIRAMTP